jgi:hypothetical protein
VPERANSRDEVHPAHVVQSIAHEHGFVRAAAAECVGRVLENDRTGSVRYATRKG